MACTWLFCCLYCTRLHDQRCDREVCLTRFPTFCMFDVHLRYVDSPACLGSQLTLIELSQ